MAPMFSEYSNWLIAPDVLPIEIAHALARAERKNFLLPGEAAMRLAIVLSYPPDLFSFLPLLPRCERIAILVGLCPNGQAIACYDGDDTQKSR